MNNRDLSDVVYKDLIEASMSQVFDWVLILIRLMLLMKQTCMAGNTIAVNWSLEERADDTFKRSNNWYAQEKVYQFVYLKHYGRPLSHP